MKTLTHIELLPLVRHCSPGKFKFYQLDKNKPWNGASAACPQFGRKHFTTCSIYVVLCT